MTKLTIYGKKNCPFCIKAIKLCEDHSIDYDYHSLDDAPKLRDIIIQSGMRTVPCIFEGSKLIGGYQELKQELELF